MSDASSTASIRAHRRGSRQGYASGGTGSITLGTFTANTGTTGRLFYASLDAAGDPAYLKSVGTTSGYWELPSTVAYSPQTNEFYAGGGCVFVYCLLTAGASGSKSEWLLMCPLSTRRDLFQ